MVGQAERVHVRAGNPTLAATVVAALASLGYRCVRWRPRQGMTFAATDELGIQAIVVIDVTRTEGGYPVAQLSPARARGMRDLCERCLREDGRRRRVRADYVALPSTGSTRGWMPLTRVRGVTWAHAHDAQSRPEGGAHHGVSL